MKCAHKNCYESRLTISRFCKLHYDEARAIATGEGYDAVPNITVFAETPEALETSLKRYRSMGYVEIGNHLGRRVGEGVEMRYVRNDTACTTGPLTATEIVQREITYWAQQGFEDKTLIALQQGNKRADRNQFAIPHRDGRVLELNYEDHHRLVCDILAANGPNKDPQYVTVRDILKSYGIIGGAK